MNIGIPKIQASAVSDFLWLRKRCRSNYCQRRIKMLPKFHKAVPFRFSVLFYLSLQTSFSNGQLTSVIDSFLNEVLGTSTQYNPVHDKFPRVGGCHHHTLNIRPNFRQMLKFTTCISEFAKHGSIPIEPDSSYLTAQIIASYGYFVEEYNNVTSKDGYIQTLYRITGSPVSPPRKGKQAMLLFHGAFTTSYSWFILKEKSLRKLEILEHCF